MKLPISTSMIDDPGPFGTLEAWEQYLTRVQSTANSVLKPYLVQDAQREIKRLKQKSTKA